MILNKLNERFWIPKVSSIIKRYCRECIMCRRMNAKGGFQLMAPIPKFRWKQIGKAFSITAVDYAGPFETVNGRGKIRNKRWMCLFTCLHTRAVHLEMSYGLDSGSFVKAYKRFIGRRGIPKVILSDNGTNFKGAIKELKNVEVSGYSIKEELKEDNIQWIFNPPISPNLKEYSKR